jgi:predicted Zn-dependent protease with MMP-like domain
VPCRKEGFIPSNKLLCGKHGSHQIMKHALKLFSLLFKSIVLLVLLYMIWYLTFPILFEHTASYKNIHFHSQNKFNTKMAIKILASASQKLESHYGERNEIEINIYDFQSSKLYALANPMALSSFGGNPVIDDKIFLYNADVNNNLAYANRAVSNKVNLRNVLIHEIVHSYQKHDYGMLKMFSLPLWVVEGHADYIRGESSLDNQTGLNLLAEDQLGESPAEWYFLSYALVKHAIDDMHATPESLYNGTLKREDVHHSFLSVVNSNRIRN